LIARPFGPNEAAAGIPAYDNFVVEVYIDGSAARVVDGLYRHNSKSSRQDVSDQGIYIS